MQNNLENNYAPGSEDIDIIENEEDSNAIASYYMQTQDENKGEDHSTLEYDPSIGLSIEGLVSGVTLDQLWRIV